MGLRLIPALQKSHPGSISDRRLKRHAEQHRRSEVGLDHHEHRNLGLAKNGARGTSEKKPSQRSGVTSHYDQVCPVPVSRGQNSA